MMSGKDADSPNHTINTYQFSVKQDVDIPPCHISDIFNSLFIICVLHFWKLELIRT
jgi:hypothetical protein